MTVITNATAGWKGAMSSYYGGQLRFTDESITIPQGLTVPDDVHVAQRTPNVYQYELIIPDGTVGFPVMADRFQFLKDGGIMDPACKQHLKLGICPYTDDMDAPPEIGDTTIFRGDCNKVMLGAWIGQIEVSGDSGAQVAATMTLRALYGYITTSITPARFNTITRKVLFNELDWTGGIPSAPLVDDSVVTPRSFRFSSNANIIDDNSYNADNPQSLRGFVYGRQAVECEVTLIGAAAPYRGGQAYTGDPASGKEPVIADMFYVGGLYTIEKGVWTTKSIVTPGPADIAVSSLTLTGMSLQQFGVGLGSFLQ